jgi:hypothetical protein
VIGQSEKVSGRCVIDEEDHQTGDLVDTIPVAARADLTGGQWAVLEPLLPAISGVGPSAGVEQAAVDRRDPVADPRGRAVAGCTGLVRVVAECV